MPARPTLKLIELDRGGFSEELDEVPSANAPMEEAPRRVVQESESWSERLDTVLGGGASCAPELHERAMLEKLAALEELWASRLSVLVAPALTGGTTVLKTFLGALRQVTVLAPDRRVLEEAQAELPMTEGYTFDSLPEKRWDTWKNVVILHANRLGERALLRILRFCRATARVVLVGDPALPMPDTEGKPFVELAEQLAPGPQVWPRVAAGYAELTVRCVKSEVLRVADWFSGRPLPAGAAEARDVPERFGVRFTRWEDSESLGKKLGDSLVSGLLLKDTSDETGFRAAATGNGKNWQLMAPTRGGTGGVDDLNRRVQVMFRKGTRQEAFEGGGRRLLGPVGWEQLVLGDRVVATSGGRRVDVTGSGLGEVATGDMGVVVGQIRDTHTAPAPWKLEVSFATRPGMKFGFRPDEFPDDRDGPLALAYALSVRWAQGNKTEVVYLVLPDKASMLTREQIYAALCCGRERVYVFYPGFADDLFRSEFPRTSDAESRFSNLLSIPVSVSLPVPGMAGDERRIAEELMRRGIEFLYQAPVEASDGSQRFPSFRFEDVLGRQVFWEHFGPVRGESDLQAQDRMVEWYEEQGIMTLEAAPWGGENGILMVSLEGAGWEQALAELLDGSDASD